MRSGVGVWRTEAPSSAPKCCVIFPSLSLSSPVSKMRPLGADDPASWIFPFWSDWILDKSLVLSSAEYEALQSPSEAFRNVTSEEILKMIEENRYPHLGRWSVWGVMSGHSSSQSLSVKVYSSLNMNGSVFSWMCGLHGLLTQDCGWHSRERVGLSAWNLWLGRGWWSLIVWLGTRDGLYSWMLYLMPIVTMGPKGWLERRCQLKW